MAVMVWAPFQELMPPLALSVQTSLSSASIDFWLCQDEDMKRGRLPLTALRSFEAAGRLSSFTAASEELFVSQAAISRQIRQLETMLGKPLFERHHRSVTLTDTGQSLLAVLTSSFDMIGGVIDGIVATPARGRVKVSCEPAFASNWLGPNLPDFHRRHPDVDVLIESDMRLIEFRANEADLAIRYGKSDETWPRTQAHRLTGVEMSPVLSPDLLRDGPPIQTPEDILKYPLLHEDDRALWRAWFAAAGLSSLDVPPGPYFTDSALVQQSALRGSGIGLADTRHATDDIAAGRLVRPFELAIAYGAYHLVARNFSRLSPAAALFAAWLEGLIGWTETISAV
jgi:LysR family transcriptional regulator, glycine cleavage system transcriptional activator